MHKETWVIVANKEKARIFEVEKFGQLKEIHAFEHPQSGLKAGDLVSDQMGRSGDMFHRGQQTKEPVTALKTKEALAFAKQIAKYLEQQKNLDHFSRLFIMAEPSFLGHLRSALPQIVTRCVESEVAKDLTKHQPLDIWSHMSIIN